MQHRDLVQFLLSIFAVGVIGVALSLLMGGCITIQPGSGWHDYESSTPYALGLPFTVYDPVAGAMRQVPAHPVACWGCRYGGKR